jgi:hypothetical protein
MNPFHKAIALTLFFAQFLAGSAQAAGMIGTIRGTVLDVKIPLFTSGFFAAFVKVQVTNENGPVTLMTKDKDGLDSFISVGDDKTHPFTLFIPFMEESQLLPTVGATCTFAIHAGKVEGMAANDIEYPGNTALADNFWCTPNR